jgi:hypothetical protein
MAQTEVRQDEADYIWKIRGMEGPESPNVLTF